jgi:hypothetical protein
MQLTAKGVKKISISLTNLKMKEILMEEDLIYILRMIWESMWKKSF